MTKLKDKEYILFDLDGTITDSSEGIMKSVDRALKTEGFYEDFANLRKFIGPSLRYSFSFYTKDEKQASRLLELYRERYADVGWKENKLYDGIKDLLECLKKAGKKVVLASSKPDIFCEKILKYFDVYDLFDYVGGAKMDGSLDDKSLLMKIILDNLGNPNKDSIIMIGDRIFDVNCAHNNGIECIGVKYGFAPENELKSVGADYIADTVSDLKRMLL